MVNVIAIFIGGGLGSLLRFGITIATIKLSWTFPTGTLLANVISSAFLGFIVGLTSMKADLSTTSRMFFITGLCGGFSTFSTFSYETLDLLNKGNYWLGGANILLNVVLCILSITTGIFVARSLPIN